MRTKDALKALETMGWDSVAVRPDGYLWAASAHKGGQSLRTYSSIKNKALTYLIFAAQNKERGNKKT